MRHAAGCSEREVVIEENISELVIVDEDEVGLLGGNGESSNETEG